jgi:hypothetical protein
LLKILEITAFLAKIFSRLFGINAEQYTEPKEKNTKFKYIL